MSRRALGGMLAVTVVAWTAPAKTQDFDAPGSTSFATGGLALLEAGTPPSSATWSIEGLWNARHALGDLTTRSLSVSGGYGALRLGAGLSQTGDPEIGWTALGLALGAGGTQGGVALRAVARRDRHPEAEPTGLGEGIGAEAGAGAWIRATRKVDLWAQAPQLWTRGGAPPLARGMTLGAAVRVDDVRAWLAIESAPLGIPVEPVLQAGVSAGGDPLTVWLAARDGPLRASIGVRAATDLLTVTADAESHPILGETLRVAIGIVAARARTP